MATALVAALALLGLPPIAQAHGRVHWSIGIGVPVYGYGWNGWYGGWGPGWGAWSYGPPVIWQAPAPPIEVQNVPLGPAPPSYWYYCSNPAGYYPQVATCPGGWSEILAQPQTNTPAPAAPATNPPSNR